MELSDIYSNNIQGKQSLGMSFSTFSGSPAFQRDPNLIKLESDIFSKLSDIATEFDVSTNNQSSSQQLTSPSICFVSFEDALKELASFDS